MNTIQTLTVYLGSSGHARPVFKEAARRLGEIIGKSEKSLVYGGMDAGLMGIVAMSAAKHGAHVTGIIPRKLKDSERILDDITDTIMVEDLWDRKKRMFAMADAVITLPGGFGTADEALEVLYWSKLNLHTKPLVLVNIEGYWDDLIAYLKTLPDFDPQVLIIVDTAEDVIPALAQYRHPGESQDLSDIKHNDSDLHRNDDKENDTHFPHFEDEIARDTDEPIIIDRASVENSYYAVCALGLKQLHKHKRAIGFLNTNSQFDGFLKWIQTAATETFITQNCLKLFSTADTRKALCALLETQDYVEIDLHAAKWGEREN